MSDMKDVDQNSFAREIKAEFEFALAGALAVMDKAAAAGMRINFDGIGQPPGVNTKHELLNLRIVRMVEEKLA